MRVNEEPATCLRSKTSASHVCTVARQLCKKWHLFLALLTRHCSTSLCSMLIYLLDVRGSARRIHQ